ncbi:MAG: SRPBCC domain-containing protein [Pseudomonadota bacterium]
MTAQGKIAQGEIRKSILIGASPERVWAYLTEAELLAKWFHPAREDLAQGKDFALLADDGSVLCWGKIIEARPPFHLKMTFTARPMNGLMTTVTFSLAREGQGTRLDLLHQGLHGADDPFGLTLAFDTGWDQHFVTLRKTI